MHPTDYSTSRIIISRNPFILELDISKHTKVKRWDWINNTEAELARWHQLINNFNHVDQIKTGVCIMIWADHVMYIVIG